MAKFIPADQLSTVVEQPSENMGKGVLQEGCKGQRISRNGMKAVLVARLNTISITIRRQGLDEDDKFNRIGAAPILESTMASSTRSRQPLWTPRKHSRLIHVLADLHNFTLSHKLHVKPSSIYELDATPMNLWFAEFKTFFDEKYHSEPSSPEDCVIQEMIDGFNPSLIQNFRTEYVLRNK